MKKIEDEISDFTNLAINATLNAKIIEAKKEIPRITNLSTASALNAKINEIKNKIHMLLTQLILLLLQQLKIKYLMLVIQSNNSDYNTKTSQIENKITTDHDHRKYITTQEFDQLKAENIPARLAQTNLASKSDIANWEKDRFK